MGLAPAARFWVGRRLELGLCLVREPPGRRDTEKQVWLETVRHLCVSLLAGCKSKTGFYDVCKQPHHPEHEQQLQMRDIIYKTRLSKQHLRECHYKNPPVRTLQGATLRRAGGTAASAKRANAAGGQKHVHVPCMCLSSASTRHLTPLQCTLLLGFFPQESRIPGGRAVSRSWRSPLVRFACV